MDDTLHEAELHMLRQMRPDYWIIPAPETRQLLAFCQELESRGLCRIERPETYADGRVRCTLTEAGRAALS